MKNILLVLIPVFTAYAGAIIATVYEIVTHSKYFRLRIILFAGLVVALSIFQIPTYKDMIEKDTTTVTAEYVKFQSSNTPAGTRKVFFENGNDQFSVYVPTFARIVGKLEVGRTYEIEYFNNSRIVKEYRLIE